MLAIIVWVSSPFLFARTFPLVPTSRACGCQLCLFFRRELNFEGKEKKKKKTSARIYAKRRSTLRKHLYLSNTHLSFRLKVSITMPLGWKENIMLILLPARSDGHRMLVITLQSTRRKNKDVRNHCDSKHHKSFKSARSGDQNSNNKKTKQKQLCDVAACCEDPAPSEISPQSPCL